MILKKELNIQEENQLYYTCKTKKCKEKIVWRFCRYLIIGFVY